MIAQLKQSLQQNATFERRSVEKASPERSLKERLAALKDSANQWQQRAPRPTPPAAHRRSSSNVLVDLPILQKLQEPVKRRSADISSGLNQFFGAHATTSTTYDPNEIDLDAISANARPVLKSVSRPRAPNRKKTTEVRIRLDPVTISEEDIKDREEEDEPEKLETQEQAIAALKSAKQLLKSKTSASPYPPVMLIRIRGSKNPDVRLVAPMMSSVHEHASFVVVHHRHLLKYDGAHSNILERTKAAQVCVEIVAKRDLNCVADGAVTVASRNALSTLLQSSENVPPGAAGDGAEPRRTDNIWRIGEEGVAQEVRERVSVKLLRPADTLLFDFGTELYVWIGRCAQKRDAVYAMKYAEQLVERRRHPTLLRRIHQGVLDTLFKAKFPDWPECREVITTCRPKATYDEDVKVADQDDEVDGLVRRMLDTPDFEPVLTLEDQEIDRGMRDVITEDLALWILRGEQLQSVEFTAHFAADQCYVLRWKYRIQKSGVRRLKSGKEEERETGRSRLAFFYWLGEHTTPKQHGLCALRIKHIDTENSPRIRVADGNEPALFLALFSGKFVVGGASEERRRFVVVGANAKETSLRHVEDSTAPLRSHAAYVEKNGSEVRVVCGANCAPEQVRFVLAHADHLAGGSGVVEVEGDATDTRAWVASSGRRRAMRAWRIFENEAEPVHHLSGHADCAFTFSQQILTETILIDVGDALWLWSEDVITTFALKVAEKYWRGRQGAAKVVYNGSEPDAFVALFPKWQKADCTPVAEPGELGKLLAERCRTFSLAELRERTSLPAGMDLRRLESYLTDADFRKAFGTARQEFYAQKAWKRNEARKRVGLF